MTDETTLIAGVLLGQGEAGRPRKQLGQPPTGHVLVEVAGGS
jgi:hypothetical protein